MAVRGHELSNWVKINRKKESGIQIVLQQNQMNLSEFFFSTIALTMIFHDLRGQLEFTFLGIQTIISFTGIIGTVSWDELAFFLRKW